MQRLRVLLGVCLLISLIAEARAGGPPEAYQEMLVMVEEGITQLSASIEGLRRRLPEFQDQLVHDPMMRELQALDRSAWELRLKQWELQLDHLTLAKQHLLAASRGTDPKARLQESWTQHVQGYEDQLEALRQQRAGLERARFRLEDQLVERHLR